MVLAVSLFAGCSSDSEKQASANSSGEKNEVSGADSPGSSAAPSKPSDSLPPGDTSGEDPGSDDGKTNAGGLDPAVKYPKLGELSTAIAAKGEVAACTEVQARLRTYRAIAANAPVSDLGLLQSSLDEFEQNVYTVADQQDWGDRMIERLTNVRRLWANAMAQAEDGAAAKKQSAEALKTLDEALAVDCPT